MGLVWDARKRFSTLSGAVWSSSFEYGVVLSTCRFYAGRRQANVVSVLVGYTRVGTSSSGVAHVRFLFD